MSGVDFDRLSSLKGQSFGRGLRRPNNTGVYAGAQLYNPAGSGVLVICNRFWIGNNAGSTWLYASMESAAYNPTTKNTFSGQNKLAGGAASAADIIAGEDASLQRVGVVFGAYFSAAGTVPVELAQPVVLPEGYGLLIENQNANSQLYTAFDWVELEG